MTNRWILTLYCLPLYHSTIIKNWPALHFFQPVLINRAWCVSHLNDIHSFWIQCFKIVTPVEFSLQLNTLPKLYAANRLSLLNIGELFLWQVWSDTVSLGTFNLKNLGFTNIEENYSHRWLVNLVKITSQRSQIWFRSTQDTLASTVHRLISSLTPSGLKYLDARTLQLFPMAHYQ